VLEVIKEIDSFDNITKTPKFQVEDIRKSLSDYSSAMSSFAAIRIFKHLFSSLELATNCDGCDRTHPLSL
jgi:hypothetical protein